MILMSGLTLAALGSFGAGPAGAVAGSTTGSSNNPTNPAVSYEADCTTSLQPGEAAPFITTTDIDTTTDTAAPVGATFGVAGAVSQTLIGPIIAGVNAELNPATVGIGVSETFGSTDGNASGTYTYTKDFAQVANPGGAVPGASWTSGSTTISGDFSAVPAGAALSGSGIPTSAVTTAAGTATSITIDEPTTAAGSGTVGWAPEAGLTETDTSFASPASAFTTDGSQGGTAGIGVISVTSFTLETSSVTVPFGGAPGVGPSNCLETGWVNATTPGPAQTGGASPPDETAPALPYGETTPLVSVTPTFQSGAYVNLVDTPPTPNDQTVAAGQGEADVITLTATPGSYPVGSYSLVGITSFPYTIPDTSLTITSFDASTGVVDTTNDASAPETDTFQFNACDTLAAANGGPVCSTTPGTVTVKIGTPPVIQPFSEQVNGGLLVLSCDSPSEYVTGNSNGTSPNGSVPAPTANPLLQCPEFQFPAITLDGLEQVVTATTAGNTNGSTPGTIYISDNRGSPTDEWTLTGTFVPTAIGSGNGENSNSSCSGVDAFCNESVGAAALNTATNGAHDGQIAPNYLQVSTISCTADATGGTTGPDGTVYNPPNLNPNATQTSGGNFGSPVTLCSASEGQSGGTFLYNATYTLTIPESVYAGNYIGSVQFTIA